MTVSGACEFYEKVVQCADDHLRLHFALARRLAQAENLEDGLHAQQEFASQSVQAYARQIQELSRFMSGYSQGARRDMNEERDYGS